MSGMHFILSGVVQPGENRWPEVNRGQRSLLVSAAGGAFVSNSPNVSIPEWPLFVSGPCIPVPPRSPCTLSVEPSESSLPRHSQLSQRGHCDGAQVGDLVGMSTCGGRVLQSCPTGPTGIPCVPIPPGGGRWYPGRQLRQLCSRDRT